MLELQCLGVVIASFFGHGKTHALTGIILALVITRKQRCSDYGGADRVTGFDDQSHALSDFDKVSYKIPRLVSTHITTLVRIGICKVPKKMVGSAASRKETADVQAKNDPVSKLVLADPCLAAFRVGRTSLEINQLYNAVWTPTCTRQFQTPGFCSRSANGEIINDINQGIYAYKSVNAVKKELSHTASRAPKQT